MMKAIYFLCTFLICFDCGNSASARIKKPFNVRTTQKFTNGVQIEWDLNNSSGLAADDNLEYLIRFRGLRPSDQNQEDWKSRSSPTNPIFLSPLENGVWYEIQVKSIIKEDSRRVYESKYSDSILVSLSEPQEPNLSRNTLEELTRPLPTPMGVKARITSDTKLKISWNKADFISDDLYYLVTIAKKEQDSDEYSNTKSQIRIQSNSFLLDRLQPGITYKIQVQSKLGPRESRQSNPAVVTMPVANEFFELSDVNIRSFMTGLTGSANLSWKIPRNILPKIEGFVLLHTTDRTAEEWAEVIVGTQPSVVIDDLPANTEHFMRITTTLNNGMEFESKLYSFMTPSAEPIQKVDVIFSSNAANVKLEWTLEDYVNRDAVAGYKVLMSVDQNIAEDQWTTFDIDDPDQAEITLEDLDSAKTYFIKISVKQYDSSPWTGKKTYRFTTLGQETSYYGQYSSLSFVKIEPGKIKVKWNQPHRDEEDVVGFLVMYTTNDDLPDEDWHKIITHGKNKTEVTLEGLNSDTEYFVKIIGRNADGSYSNLESGIYVINSGKSGRVDAREEKSRWCLQKCDPDTTHLSGCQLSEKCVKVGHKGWCIPKKVITAVKNIQT